MVSCQISSKNHCSYIYFSSKEQSKRNDGAYPPGVRYLNNHPDALYLTILLVTHICVGDLSQH